MNKQLKNWISAFRLRTLALSFALIITGSAVAIQHHIFSMATFLLALLTTLFLQVLSNISNDYGDSASGVDGAGRVGPTRAVQSGAISLHAMRNAIWVFAILSLISGIALLVWVLPVLGTRGMWTMLGIGLLCIAAAITYTVGKRPYGYMGLGDISVFIFFGLVGVMGSYILYAGVPDITTLPLASAIGLMSVGVLNMNNLRDYESDKNSGKHTFVVKIGPEKAKTYQQIVICSALALFLCYILFFGEPTQLICLFTFPAFIRHLIVINDTENHSVIDSQLKIVSLSTCATSVLFLVGTLL